MSDSFYRWRNRTNIERSHVYHTYGSRAKLGYHESVSAWTDREGSWEFRRGYLPELLHGYRIYNSDASGGVVVVEPIGVGCKDISPDASNADGRCARGDRAQKNLISVVVTLGQLHCIVDGQYIGVSLRDPELCSIRGHIAPHRAAPIIQLGDQCSSRRYF